MTDLIPFLKTLLSASGLSGNELPIRRLIEDTWRPLVDETSMSRVGSLHALRRGTGAEPRSRVLLSAHMDAIGLMVTGITDGFLRFTQVGGVDHRILPGQIVTVHGRKDLPAVVAMPPARLLPANSDGPVPMDQLFLDTGLLPEETAEFVRVGDLVSFGTVPTELGGDTLAGHSLDNRASVAAVTCCLDELQRRIHTWDVWAVASVQEEVTLGGAMTSAFDVRPDIAIAIDVTFAKGPGSNDYDSFPLGKGITLAWGPNIHPAVYKLLKNAADTVEIPYTMETAPRHSGTDAMGLQTAAEGIPTAVVSIPLRYMHTPVEVVSIKDIRRTGRLLAEFITRLEVDTREKLTWDN
ncbi:MAG: M42 family peptidase [Anaerolineaceae bacterium]